jgi:hypothetical protein
MAHRGKLYPVFNPARCLVQDASWPQWFATEYRFEAREWSGALGSLCPPTGRGVVPTGYTLGDTTIRYRKTFSLTGTDELLIGFDWKIGTPSANPQTILVCEVNGISQVTTTPYGSPSGNLGGFLYGYAEQYSEAPGFLAFPYGGVDFFAYRWTDPAPKPPNSSPF